MFPNPKEKNMIERKFVAGKTIYDDVVVPNGVEIYEKFDEDKKTMCIDWSINGVRRISYRMSLNSMNLEEWNLTEEDMRRIIVSGFIDYAAKKAAHTI